MVYRDVLGDKDLLILDTHLEGTDGHGRVVPPRGTVLSLYVNKRYSRGEARGQGRRKGYSGGRLRAVHLCDLCH